MHSACGSNNHFIDLVLATHIALYKRAISLRAAAGSTAAILYQITTTIADLGLGSGKHGLVMLASSAYMPAHGMEKSADGRFGLFHSLR